MIKLSVIRVVIDKLGAACCAALIIIGGSITFMLLYPKADVPELLAYLAGCAVMFLFGVGLTNAIASAVAKAVAKLNA